ncbi:MAG TPA: protein kinase, partial [Candidatus Omnitrophota bacterium]|nr:protein kinase [Candidatus Omnitrophota bacterium]
MGIAGLDPSEWERLSRILDAALELPLADRSRYLDEACGGHESLRLAAEAVLAADAARGGILDSPLSIPDELRREPPPRGEDDPPSDTLPAEPIGPFRVLRELGRGGMAVVYLAERVDGAFEQRVAIKVIKRGLDTDEVLARFVLERNILARLEHPNIARLIDGGVTADGLPYFAMEAVDGEPITDHLAGRDASLYEVL